MAAYISFQPTDFFNPLLYTGTGAASQAQTGVGFQPDFTWIKGRDAAESNALFDSVRGVEQVIYSNTTAAEATIDGLTAFGADGFTVGNDGKTGSSGYPPNGYVSWNWKAGTTSGIATNGSTTITPTGYSFNQTSGFSTIAYTGNSTSGAKIPHGLGVAPDLMFVKKLNAGQSWAVYSESLGPTKYLSLNQTIAEATSIDRWNDTATDSVNFTVGDSGDTNGAFNYIAYCFASKKGFSAFGSYYGNGNADGPFVYTGFIPAFLICKISSGNTGGWDMFDNKRDTFNPTDQILQANSSSAEADSDDIDFLANGFKIRNTSGNHNGNGYTYIYMAFAEFPFVSSNSKAGVAR